MQHLCISSGHCTSSLERMNNNVNNTNKNNNGITISMELSAKGNGKNHVEDLVKCQKELLQEKSRLTKKLSNLKQKKNELDHQLMEIENKHMQVMETRNKGLDTLKIAQHKVEQSQSQCNSLETIHKDRRTIIDQLSSETRQQKALKQQNVMQFLNILAEMADRLRYEKDAHKRESLNQKCCEVEKLKIELEKEVRQQDQEKMDLETMLLTLQKETRDDLEIPLEQQLSVFNMFKDENSAANANLVLIEQSEANQAISLQELVTDCDSISQQLLEKANQEADLRTLMVQLHSNSDIFRATDTTATDAHQPDEAELCVRMEQLGSSIETRESSVM